LSTELGFSPYPFQIPGRNPFSAGSLFSSLAAQPVSGFPGLLLELESSGILERPEKAPKGFLQQLVHLAPISWGASIFRHSFFRPPVSGLELIVFKVLYDRVP
jgi:hypothetical protein